MRLSVRSPENKEIQGRWRELAQEEGTEQGNVRLRMHGSSLLTSVNPQVREDFVKLHIRGVPAITGFYAHSKDTPVRRSRVNEV
jgi:hypothetical protein